MIDRLGVHRLDEAEIVRHGREVRHQFADPRAASAVLPEAIFRRRDREAILLRRHAGEPLAAANGVGKIDAAHVVELRLVVEEVHLRRSARLEEIDDALGLGGEVRQAGQAVGAGVVVEQGRERGGAETDAGTLEEVAAGLQVGVLTK